MAEETKVMHSTEPAAASTGRKRGRPRKDDSRSSDSAIRRYQKVDQGSHSNSIPIGQSVSGVLDGKFDAGYMLTVRVGNTGTVLRGVVFEPGRSVPITAANDIAPHIRMVTRAEIPVLAVPELLNQTPPVKSRTVIPAAPSVVPGDKTGGLPLTGTFVVPVTLTPKTPMHRSSVDESKVNTESHQYPTVSSQPLNTETDKTTLLTADGLNTIPQSGPTDTSGLSSAYDSKNVLEVQKTDDKKPDIASPAIADPGTMHQAGASPSREGIKPSDVADPSSKGELMSTVAGAGTNMA